MVESFKHRMERKSNSHQLHLQIKRHFKLVTMYAINMVYTKQLVLFVLSMFRNGQNRHSRGYLLKLAWLKVRDRSDSSGRSFGTFSIPSRMPSYDRLKAKRKVQVSVIDSIKGDYGFIVNEEGDDGKNLFFHSSNLVEIKMSDLSAGDSVSFSLIHNK